MRNSRVAVSQRPDLMGQKCCACILTAFMSMKRAPDTWFAAGNRGLMVVEGYKGTMFRTCIHSSVLKPRVVLEAHDGQKEHRTGCPVDQFFVDLCLVKVARRGSKAPCVHPNLKDLTVTPTVPPWKANDVPDV